MYECKSFRVEIFEDVAIVTLKTADLWDRAEIHHFSDEMLDYLQSESPKKLILDLGTVGRVSSEALNALIRLRDEVTARNAELRLCNLREPVQEVLKITELGSLFHIYDTLPDAFRGFAEMPQ
jgi:anti-anti-sigma factor